MDESGDWKKKLVGELEQNLSTTEKAIITEEGHLRYFEEYVAEHLEKMSLPERLNTANVAHRLRGNIEKQESELDIVIKQLLEVAPTIFDTSSSAARHIARVGAIKRSLREISRKYKQWETELGPANENTEN